MKVLTHVVVFVGVLLTARAAAAQSCLTFLGTTANAVGASGELVTLNNKGIASATRFNASFQPAGKTPQGGQRPAQWSASGATQLFSDRQVGAPGPSQQPFVVSKGDSIDITITIEASPQVTIVLSSWGNAKVTFRTTCSPGGVLHGSTPDVDYLLFLVPTIVR